MTQHRLAPPKLALLAALYSVTLMGCLRHENDPGQGGLTVGENKELDDAAAMLDARAKAPAPPDVTAADAPVDAAANAKQPLPNVQAQPTAQQSAGNTPSEPNEQPQPQRPSLGGIGRASPQHSAEPAQPAKQ